MASLLDRIFKPRYTISELLSIDQGRQARAASCRVTLVNTFYSLKEETLMDKVKNFLNKSPKRQVFYITFKFQVKSDTGNTHPVYIQVDCECAVLIVEIRFFYATILNRVSHSIPLKRIVRSNHDDIRVAEITIIFAGFEAAIVNYVVIVSCTQRKVFLTAFSFIRFQIIETTGSIGRVPLFDKCVHSNTVLLFVQAIEYFLCMYLNFSDRPLQDG